MGSRPLGRDLHERKTEKAGLLFPACDATRFRRQHLATAIVVGLSASKVISVLHYHCLHARQARASALAALSTSSRVV